MAFAATELSTEPRAWSVGPYKMKILSYSAASADVSGTVTVNDFSEVIMLVADEAIPGLTCSYSGNVVTLAFTDPATTIGGRMMVIGR